MCVATHAVAPVIRFQLRKPLLAQCITKLARGLALWMALSEEGRLCQESFVNLSNNWKETRTSVSMSATKTDTITVGDDERWKTGLAWIDEYMTGSVCANWRTSATSKYHSWAAAHQTAHSNKSTPSTLFAPALIGTISEKMNSTICTHHINHQLWTTNQQQTHDASTQHTIGISQMLLQCKL